MVYAIRDKLGNYWCEGPFAPVHNWSDDKIDAALYSRTERLTYNPPAGGLWVDFDTGKPVDWPR